MAGASLILHQYLSVPAQRSGLGWVGKWQSYK